MAHRRVVTVSEALASLFEEADEEFFGEEGGEGAGLAMRRDTDSDDDDADGDAGGLSSGFSADHDHFLDRLVDPGRLAGAFIERPDGGSGQESEEDDPSHDNSDAHRAAGSATGGAADKDGQSTRHIKCDCQKDGLAKFLQAEIEQNKLNMREMEKRK